MLPPAPPTRRPSSSTGSPTSYWNDTGTDSQSRVRVVVVLGPGAAVWSGLPTWDEGFKQRLIAAAGNTLRSEDTFVSECWRALKMVIGQPARDPS